MLSATGCALKPSSRSLRIPTTTDYRGFEAAIIADYDARTAVERELVLRLHHCCGDYGERPRSRPICSGFKLRSYATAGSVAARSDCRTHLSQFSELRITAPKTSRTTASPRRIVSGALAPPCIELVDPEDTRRHFRIGSHIWLTI
jgi:hypothetical protein